MGLNNNWLRQAKTPFRETTFYKMLSPREGEVNSLGFPQPEGYYFDYRFYKTDFLNGQPKGIQGRKAWPAGVSHPGQRAQRKGMADQVHARSPGCSV